jgi:hypothetical protein
LPRPFVVTATEDGVSTDCTPNWLNRSHCSGRSRVQVVGYVCCWSQSDVVAVEDDAGCDAGEPAVGFVGGEVGEDAVVALPVEG